MLINNTPTYYDQHTGSGFFAGSDDGVVKVAGKAAIRELICFDVDTLAVVRRVWSLENGHYWVPALNEDRRYLLICRDHKAEYRPQGWDYRLPSTSLTLEQQKKVFADWQT